MIKRDHAINFNYRANNYIYVSMQDLKLQRNYKDNSYTYWYTAMCMYQWHSQDFKKRVL